MYVVRKTNVSCEEKECSQTCEEKGGISYEKGMTQRCRKLCLRVFGSGMLSLFNFLTHWFFFAGFMKSYTLSLLFILT